MEPITSVVENFSQPCLTKFSRTDRFAHFKNSLSRLHTFGYTSLKLWTTRFV
jgi:hypothetical protein